MSSDDNDFEEERRKLIQRNQDILAKVGLQETVDDLAEKHRARKRAQAEEKKAKKRKKLAVPAFPTRRSMRSAAAATRTKLKGMADSGGEASSEEEGASESEGTSESGSDSGIDSEGGLTAEDSDAGDVDSGDYFPEGERELHREGRGGFGEGRKPRAPQLSQHRKVCVSRGDGKGTNGRKSKDVRRGTESSRKSSGSSAAMLNIKDWPTLGAPEIEEGFRKFDVEGIGLTTVARIEEVAESLNVYFDDGQLEAMLDFAMKTTGCDGEIMTLQEFEGLIANLV